MEFVWGRGRIGWRDFTLAGARGLLLAQTKDSRGSQRAGKMMATNQRISPLDKALGMTGRLPLIHATMISIMTVSTVGGDWRALHAQQTVAPSKTATATEFPAELVDWRPRSGNPIFQGAGPGHWDAKIRERGWILREGDTYHLWYTGYDGTREGIKRLGYATSADGLHWTRAADNPLIREHWVEDMMVVKHDGTYYMFAEGVRDQAQLLSSTDRVHWTLDGTLDIRDTSGKPISAGPFGTPTAWFENETWYLFYERMDRGVWLATTKGLAMNRKALWTNVLDQPLLVPGPDAYDKLMIALNQIVKREGAYFAYYHGSGDLAAPRKWSTNVARSTDLLHWTKYPGNPIVSGDTSSGIVVPDGHGYRLYTMHDHVDVYDPSGK
jgi:hypothetical protein